MARSMTALVFLASAALAACDAGPQSGRGFTLPVGDAARGEQTFVSLECNACHVVEGVEAYEADGKPPISVKLGGEVTRVKTYGDLVTSIINPSHKIAPGYPAEMVQTEGGQSKMLNYNNIMKVSQLIDLVAFLESKYKLVPYQPTDYPAYTMY